MLTGSGHWSAANVDRVLARGKTVAAQPDKPVLVVITYQTAVVAANGTVQFLPDIYGRDKQALRMVTRWQTDSARRLDQLAALNSGRR